MMASHNAVLTQLKGSNFYPLLFNAYPLYLYDTFLLVRCLLITVKLFLLQLSFSLVDLFPLQTMPVIITQAMPLPQEFAHWFGPRKGTINAFFLYLFYPYLVPFVILSALCPTNNSLPPPPAQLHLPITLHPGFSCPPPLFSYVACFSCSVGSWGCHINEPSSRGQFCWHVHIRPKGL